MAAPIDSEAMSIEFNVKLNAPRERPTVVT